MEPVPRTTAPLHATGAVSFVPLAAVAADLTFRLREEGDVSLLAASVARLGQLVPVELRPLPGQGDGPPRYQLVSGFRRVAAMRLLARQRVLARVHARLDDADAWGLALTQALLGEPLQAEELVSLRDRLEATGQAGWAVELVDEALVRAPVPPEQRERFHAFLSGAPAAPAVDEDAAAAAADAEVQAAAPGPAAAPAAEPPVEVTPDELARDLATRLWELNQDLALAFEAWADLPAEGRRLVVEQARYVAELYPLLAGGTP